MVKTFGRLATIAVASQLIASGAFAAGGQVLSFNTYRNPAEMTRVEHFRGELGYYLVDPIDQNSDGDFSTTFVPLATTLTGKVDSHTNYNLPYVGLVGRCGKWAYGLELTQPFRTKINYGGNSPARLAVTDVNILTYDLSPRVAYEVCPQLSLGFGLNIQYERVILDSTTFIAPNVERPFLNEGDNVDYGFDVGMMWTPRLGTIFSASYYSGVHHQLEGDSELVGINKTDNATARFDRPWSIHTRLFQAFNRQMGAYLGYTYVHWKFLKTTTLYNTALPGPASNVVVNFFYDDSHRVDLGGRFVSEDNKWEAIAGLYWMNTPTSGIYRALLLPEGDRSGVLLRLSYKVTPCFTVRALYSHLFVADAHINTGTTVTQNGTMRARADVWGLNVIYDM